jgi:hypothetical protein
LEDLFDFAPNLSVVDSQALQDIERYSLPLHNQAQQDMLGANIFVPKVLRLLVGQLHHLASAISEL